MPGTPSPLHPAPSRSVTPLPGSFALAQDASTRDFDGGTVLLGGSPLRLFRISERARRLVERWRAGVPVGPGRGAQLLARRLVSAGAFCPRPDGGSFGPGDVTVVIPVRDRSLQLHRLLGSLRGLACIVVDDASADAGATKETAERHGARFVGLATNVGPAGARNAGLAAVESALVAFVDSDCVPTDGWLAPLLGHFDDPLVAAVAPRIVPDPDPPLGGRTRHGPVRSSLDRGPREGPVRPGGPIPFVPSAALLVRVDAVAGPALFDPTLRGGEDVDLVWRLCDAGWDVRYVPSSTVVHDGPATLGAFLARRAFYGTTAAALARRHGDAMAPVHLSGWSLAVWTLALARRPVLALAVLATSVALLAQRLRGLVARPGRGGDAHRGRRHGAGRPAGPGIAGPGLVAGARARAGLPTDPHRVGAGPPRPRARRLGARPRNAGPGARRRTARGGRRGLRAGCLVRLRPPADARPAHPPRLVAFPRVVPRRAAPRAANAGREGLTNRLWSTVTRHRIGCLSSSW